MSASESGGLPHSEDEYFRPRSSLLRTPPRRMIVSPGRSDVLKTPPFQPGTPRNVINAAEAAYAAVIQAHSPGTSPPPPANTPISPRQAPFAIQMVDDPAPTARPASRATAKAKRVLSPDEYTEVGNSKRRPTRMTSLRPQQSGSSRLGVATPATEYGTPFTTDDDEADASGEGHLAHANGRQLMARANAFSRSIAALAGTSSKMNRTDMAAINSDLSQIMEVVAHLGMLAEQQRAEIISLRTTVSEREDAWMRDKRRAAKAEADAEVARVEATKVAVGAAPVVRQPMSYADKLRARAPSGPMVALYPVEGSSLTTSEAVKTAVKTSVAPAKLNIKVDRVRRVGNAGVIIQTRTRDDMVKLKAALPDTVKASELKGRSPLVVLRDLDGKEPEFVETITSLHGQNFKDDANWTLEKMLSSCRLAFRKSRHGSAQSAMILACTPELRRALVERSRLYINWISCRVDDFTIAICCSKCAMYGHNEKKCKQEAVTCFKCGVLGHKSSDCEAEAPRCATCHRFGQKGSETHETGARDCPARVHAERRMVESTDY